MKAMSGQAAVKKSAERPKGMKKHHVGA